MNVPAEDLSPELVAALATLTDEYGPRGVADALGTLYPGSVPFREHSVQLNGFLWRLAVALGMVDPEQEDSVDLDPERVVSQSVAAIAELRRDGPQLRQWAIMVADLDRSEHGRHEGDVQSGSPTGVSEGNPHLPTGARLGYSLDGTYAYVMPERGRRHDPEAWKVRLR